MILDRLLRNVNVPRNLRVRFAGRQEAQDLILAHRVKDYRAGELERRYRRLAIEEAFFVNYGFLPRKTAAPAMMDAKSASSSG